jgi:hypothetical protein
MNIPSESQHLSVSINQDFDHVYEFLSFPENFPKWASGLAGSLRKVGEEWIAKTPEGLMKVRFSEPNNFGVLDHWVSPSSEIEIYIPLRIIPNGNGCELILTLFRLPGMSAEKFSDDAEWVLRDLNAAKHILERHDA